MSIDMMIDRLRATYSSCHNVVSEQISTFIASVSLFIGSKYNEIKYPVVQDVCTLMGCPFTFDEFIEMERVMLEVYEFNLQLPTVIDIVSTIMSQGIVYSNDKIVVKINHSSNDPSSQSQQMKDVPLLSQSKAKIDHVIKKTQNLSEFLPNIILSYGEFFLNTPPLHMAIASILVAR